MAECLDRLRFKNNIYAISIASLYSEEKLYYYIQSYKVSSWFLLRYPHFLHLTLETNYSGFSYVHVGQDSGPPLSIFTYGSPPLIVS